MKLKLLGAAIVSLMTTSGVVAGDEAQAAILVTVQQAGPDIVATTSGTLNLTGLTRDNSVIFVTAGVNVGIAYFSAVTSDFASRGIDRYRGIAGPSNFGPSTPGNFFQFASSGVKDQFVIGGDVPGDGRVGEVGVPKGYVSGAPLAATTTFSGKTFASLGLRPGTYVFTAPADIVTVQIGAVPEPSTWAMMIGGFGMVGGAMRSARRKRKVTVSYA